MGNSLTTFIRATQSSGGHVTSIKDLKYTMQPLQLIAEPQNTFLFHSMTDLQQQAVFNTALFLNREVSGIRTEDLETDKRLTKKLKPLAVFQDSEVIAIAEGVNHPFYAFAYAVEAI